MTVSEIIFYWNLLVHIPLPQKRGKNWFTNFIEFYQGKNGKASIGGGGKDLILYSNTREKTSLTSLKVVLKFPVSVFHLEAHIHKLQIRHSIPTLKRCLENCKCYREPYKNQNVPKFIRTCFSQIFAQTLTITTIKYYAHIWSCQRKGLTEGVWTEFHFYSTASDLEPRNSLEDCGRRVFLLCFNSKTY